MEHIYRLENNISSSLIYTKVTIDTQEWKDVIFSAIASEDPDIKYKAGLWCEAEAEQRMLEFNGLIVSNELENNQNFLKRLAAVYYQASYLLKPNIDAMFRYAQFVDLGKIDRDKRIEAVKMIAEAAESGHGNACDHYAAILYEDKKDYRNAERFWMLAVQNNVPRAYSCLWSVYRDGKACEPDLDKAIGFLRLGVEQENRDCLYALGRCYYEGDGVQKDIEKSRVLLKKASEQGHGIARLYLAMEVNDGTNYLADQLQELGRMLSNDFNSHIKNTEISPYSMCMCGSEKKYKWCCKNKEITDNQKHSILGYDIPSRLKLN